MEESFIEIKSRMPDLEPVFRNPPPVKVKKKQGRNDLCLCGSKKKFKKCCL